MVSSTRPLAGFRDPYRPRSTLFDVLRAEWKNPPRSFAEALRKQSNEKSQQKYMRIVR